VAPLKDAYAPAVMAGKLAAHYGQGVTLPVKPADVLGGGRHVSCHACSGSVTLMSTGWLVVGQTDHQL
jgi:hypothetical protein